MLNPCPMANANTFKKSQGKIHMPFCPEIQKRQMQ